MSTCVIRFFFFKQKTAYEMRISDWSSDVCSSDLRAQHIRDHDERRKAIEEAVALTRRTVDFLAKHGLACDTVGGAGTGTYPFEIAGGVHNELQAGRSEERRVGKESGSTCQSRWSPDHLKKKIKQ